MSRFQVIEKPQKGSILIAEPLLGDPNFNRSIILLTEHNENGSVGFVINKPLEVELDDIVLEFPSLPSQIFHGGPVQEDNLYFIHNKGSLLPGSEPIGHDLYWGGDLAPMKELITCGLLESHNVRFFLGYSGWGQGQLEAELEEKSWVVIDGAGFDLFADNDIETWKAMLSDLGDEYTLWLNAPPDPNMN